MNCLLVKKFLFKYKLYRMCDKCKIVAWNWSVYSCLHSSAAIVAHFRKHCLIASIAYDWSITCVKCRDLVRFWKQLVINTDHPSTDSVADVRLSTFFVVFILIFYCYYCSNKACLCCCFVGCFVADRCYQSSQAANHSPREGVLG